MRFVIDTPQKIGPMLSSADIVVITKGDIGETIIGKNLWKLLEQLNNIHNKIMVNNILNTNNISIIKEKDYEIEKCKRSFRINYKSV